MSTPTKRPLLVSTPEDPSTPLPSASNASRLWFFGFATLIVAGVVAAFVFQPAPAPPPEEIANDPLLAEGHRLYQMRCVSCHGATGRGDGPIAGSIGPNKPGNLASGEWKHGDRPEQVLGVIKNGVPGTNMAGWSDAFDEDQRHALAAYVYYLAGKTVPGELRRSPSQPSNEEF